jgi:hypothetical protein
VGKLEDRFLLHSVNEKARPAAMGLNWGLRVEREKLLPEDGRLLCRQRNISPLAGLSAAAGVFEPKAANDITE